MTTQSRSAGQRFLALFTPLSTAIGLGMGMALVATGLMAVQLGATGTQIAWIAAAQSIGTFLVSVQAGILIDRHGPSVPFSLASVLMALVCFAIPAFPSPWWLLGFTAALSLLSPFRFISMTATFLGQLQSIGESKAGWQRASSMVGTYLLGPAAGAVAVTELGFPTTWRLIGALSLLTAFAGPFVFSHHSAKLGAGPRLNLRGVLQQIALFRDEPILRKCASLDSTVHAITAFFGFFMVVISVRELGLTPFAATHFVNAKGISFILALLLLGGVVSKLGTNATSRWSFAILTISLFALAVSQSVPVLLVASLLLGLGLGTAQITNMTLQARVGDRIGQGRVAGVMPLANTAASLLGNLGGGLLGGWIGLHNVFWVLGAIPLALLAVLVARPRQGSEDDVVTDSVGTKGTAEAA